MYSISFPLASKILPDLDIGHHKRLYTISLDLYMEHTARSRPSILPPKIIINPKLYIFRRARIDLSTQFHVQFLSLHELEARHQLGRHLVGRCKFVPQYPREQSRVEKGVKEALRMIVKSCWIPSTQLHEHQGEPLNLFAYQGYPALSKSFPTHHRKIIYRILLNESLIALIRRRSWTCAAVLVICI